MALSLLGDNRSRDEDVWDWPGGYSLDYPSWGMSTVPRGMPLGGGWDWSMARPEQSKVARDVASVANTQVDWRETPEAHIFKANLPGVRKEDVKVEVEDGRVLQISGEREKEEVEDSERWHRLERAHASFLRRFRLPDNARLDQVSANMEHGVLTVTVPKSDQIPRTVKTIDILPA